MDKFIGRLRFVGSEGAAAVPAAIAEYVKSQQRPPLAIVVRPGFGMLADGLPVYERQWVQEGHIFIVSEIMAEGVK